MTAELGAQLEAHGLYLVFIAAVLLLVLIMTIDAIAEGRRERRRRQDAAALQRTVSGIARGLVAERNQSARWQG